MSFYKSSFLLTFFISLTCIASNSQAQSQAQSQEIRNRFNQAANEHRFFITDLYNSRAVVENPYSYPLSSQDISAEGIASTLALASEAGYCCLPELGVTYQEKTAVLFYAFNQDSLQIWLIDQSGILAYYRHDINEERIIELVNQFRDSLGIYPQQSLRIPLPRSLAIVYKGNGRSPTFEQANLELAELLLPEPITTGIEDINHLLVVPILNIGTVPYGALKPFQDDSFLIDKMSISIAPSLYDLGIEVHPWDATSTFSSSLIVGDPFLPSSESWNLPPLPGAQQEARAVAQLVGTEPLIAEAATKEAVLARVQQSEFIYFATHGISDFFNPLDSGFLMFSAPTLEQGWWTAREIQNTRLIAQIAVLSACQTGLGGVHDAGIIGVARAFQIAGVPRVVMSLWNVNDESTSKLMQSFVKHLESEAIPAEALRQAMIDTREIYPNPKDWASFILFGSPR